MSENRTGRAEERFVDWDESTVEVETQDEHDWKSNPPKKVD